MRFYPVLMEVSGTVAMFSRPDSGGTPVSYPAPTWSAAKGIFDSIAFFTNPPAFICPTHVEICRTRGSSGGAIEFQNYTTNYGGPLRKNSVIEKESNMQVFASVLSNVCYRLHGTVLGPSVGNRVNPRHHLQHLFNRRLKQGRCFRVPRLGWSEFVCTYWGPPRIELTEVDDGLNLEIPSMLMSMWSNPVNGNLEPRFKQSLKITNGVLDYGLSDEELSDMSNIVSVPSAQ